MRVRGLARPCAAAAPVYRNPFPMPAGRGWAITYVRDSDEYTPAEAMAKSKERGIWVSDFEMPWDWRKMMRGE